MPVNYIGAAALLAILLVSARLYDHRDQRYARGKSKRIASPGAFALVYRFIQLSTAFVGMGAFLFDHAVFLEVHNEPLLVLVGSLVSLSGLAVFVAAKTALGAHYSPCFDSFVPSAIVREGIYRRIRHPIYTGNFLVLGGLTVATGSAWLALNFVLLLCYYNAAARTEESALAAQFAEYRPYLQHTGRFLPRLKRRYAREA